MPVTNGIIIQLSNQNDQHWEIGKAKLLSSWWKLISYLTKPFELTKEYEGKKIMLSKSIIPTIFKYFGQILQPQIEGAITI